MYINHVTTDNYHGNLQLPVNPVHKMMVICGHVIYICRSIYLDMTIFSGHETRCGNPDCLFELVMNRKTYLLKIHVYGKEGELVIYILCIM